MKESNNIEDWEYRYINSRTLSKGNMIFYDGNVYVIDRVITDRLRESIVTCICHNLYSDEFYRESIVLNLYVEFR